MSRPYRIERFVLVICTCLYVGFNLYGQNVIDSTDVQRPKIAEFTVEVLTDYKTTSSSETYGNASSEVEKERLIKTKLGIPFILNDKRVMGVQLKYYQRRFDFETEKYPTNYDLYSHLAGEKLTTTGFRFFWKQNLKKSNKLTFITGVEIASDRIMLDHNSTRYFVSGIYNWKLSSSVKMGLGLVYTGGMRIPTAYPLFTYVKQFSSRWILDLSLPKSMAITRKINNGSYLIAKTQVKGWRYRLTNAIEGGSSYMTLRKADVLFTISWEKEIHDWLWFGLDIGRIKNLRYHLTNIGDRRRDALIDIKARDAGYLKCSIFIVPPRRFY